MQTSAGFPLKPEAGSRWTDPRYSCALGSIPCCTSWKRSWPMWSRVILLRSRVDSTPTRTKMCNWEPKSSSSTHWTASCRKTRYHHQNKISRTNRTTGTGADYTGMNSESHKTVLMIAGQDWPWRHTGLWRKRCRKTLHLTSSVLNSELPCNRLCAETRQ